MGLCSKSKLSKIENGTLQPNIALSQSLLQRLGISDAVFEFYGDEHETALHELRQKLTLTRSFNIDAIQNYTEKMLQLCEANDSFYKQYAAYKEANYIPDKEKSAGALLQALRITLPNFTLNDISNYRLSWLELTILNNYSNAYRKYLPSKGTLALYKLLEYYDTAHLDILEKKRLFSIPLCDLSSVLHQQNRFSELIELTPYISSNAIKCSLDSMSVFLANYAQALGEIKLLDKVPLYATYAYYNLIITDSTKAVSLKKWIYDDFGIKLQ